MAKLEADEAELREMGQTTLDWVVAYYESIRERALVRPATSATVRGLLKEGLPREGCSFTELMQTVDGVNDRLQMDVAELERMVREDRSPLCIVASAGTAGTGAFDPLAEIAKVARRESLWLHVDGPYGGFAALDPSARPLIEAIAEADS